MADDKSIPTPDDYAIQTAQPIQPETDVGQSNQADDSDKKAMPEPPLTKPKKPKEPDLEKEGDNEFLNAWIYLQNAEKKKAYEEEMKQYEKLMEAYNAQQERNATPKPAAPTNPEPKTPEVAPTKSVTETENEVTNTNTTPEPSLSVPANTQTSPSPSTSDVAALNSLNSNASTSPAIETDQSLDNVSSRRLGS